MKKYLLYLLTLPVLSFHTHNDVFNPNADILTIVKKEYPNATMYKDFIIDFARELKNNHDINMSNLSPAFCSCSDEINRSTDELTILGKEFIMGGLAGIPYCGKTGIMAFSHHIKDNGVAFIFYGPHIGISDIGELGKVLRKNQRKYSSSCGALSLALQRFQKNKNYHHQENDEEDFEQMLLENMLEKRKDDFLNSKNPTKEITEVTYKIIEEKIENLIFKYKKEFHIKKIVLVGGVIINTSYYFDDYIDVRKKQIIDLEN